MSDSPIDSVKYAAVLKQTRMRRKFFFATILAYIPALLVTHKISPTNKAMGTVFGIWVVILIISTFLVALSKCPRCGNYFHMHGLTLLVLRKCLHCQLHIKHSDL
ncbi:MAG: hypothetical protein PHY09_05715 [Desulfuromonadaceae bacterium]|nr:hypothetical protein [Desulfuromonadaceae bacterium]MDD5107248.1 hypothetical protein [Desulfuromonadaceae bacterium]